MKTGSPKLFSIEHTPFLSSSIEQLVDESGILLVGRASNIRQALGALALQDPDIIVVDMNLPDMDGLDAVPLLLRQAPRAKVIVLTDDASDRYQVVARKKGAQVCLKKTRMVSDLLPLLKQIVETSQQLDQLNCGTEIHMTEHSLTNPSPVLG